MKEKCGGVSLSNEDVYMSTTYKDFVKITVLKSRGVSLKKPFTYDAVSHTIVFFQNWLEVSYVCCNFWSWCGQRA